MLPSNGAFRSAVGTKLLVAVPVTSTRAEMLSQKLNVIPEPQSAAGTKSSMLKLGNSEPIRSNVVPFKLAISNSLPSR